MHASLNMRRKFFHALAVLMFVPGIAVDVRRLPSPSYLDAGISTLTLRHRIARAPFDTARLHIARLLGRLLPLHLCRVRALLCPVPDRRALAHLLLRVRRLEGRRARHPEPLLPLDGVCGRPVARGEGHQSVHGRARARRGRQSGAWPALRSFACSLHLTDFNRSGVQIAGLDRWQTRRSHALARDDEDTRRHGRVRLVGRALRLAAPPRRRRRALLGAAGPPPYRTGSKPVTDVLNCAAPAVHPRRHARRAARSRVGAKRQPRHPAVPVERLVAVVCLV